MRPATAIFFTTALAFLALPLAFAPKTGALDATADWVIGGDFVVKETTRAVPGFIVVMPGAYLHIEGAQVSVGRGIIINQGASLEIRSSGTTPSRLTSLDADGYWIENNGTMTIHGRPTAVIDGLAGDGAYALNAGGAGIVVRGTLTVTDAVFENSTAGILVMPNGNATVTDTEFRDIATVAIGTRATTTLSNVSIHAGQAVAGGPGCDVRIQDSSLDGETHGIQLDACRLVVEESHVSSRGTTVAATGAAHVVLHAVHLTDYAGAGVDVRSPAGSGPQDARVDLADVFFKPRPPREMDAEEIAWNGSRGVALAGPLSATMRRLTITGHESHGIEIHGSTFIVDASKIQENGGWGIYAPDTPPNGDVRSNQFGERRIGTLNALGAVSAVLRFNAYAVDAHGHPASGLALKIYGEGSAEPIFVRAPGGPNVVAVAFETFAADALDRPQSLAPFRYEADHASFEAPKTGTLETAAEDLVFTVAGSARPASLAVGPLSFAVATCLALLIVVAFGWRRRLRD